MGKTSLVLNIGDNVAAAGKTVLFISLEMTEEQLWARRAAILSGLSHEAILKGQISDEDKEWERIMTATNELTKRPLIIHDSPCTLEEIEQEARCTENLGLLIIDHIGLISRERGRNRYEETTDISLSFFSRLSLDDRNIVAGIGGNIPICQSLIQYGLNDGLPVLYDLLAVSLSRNLFEVGDDIFCGDL